MLNLDVKFTQGLLSRNGPLEKLIGLKLLFKTTSYVLTYVQQEAILKNFSDAFFSEPKVPLNGIGKICPNPLPQDTRFLRLQEVQRPRQLQLPEVLRLQLPQQLQRHEDLLLRDHVVPNAN